MEEMLKILHISLKNLTLLITMHKDVFNDFSIKLETSLSKEYPPPAGVIPKHRTRN